MTPARKKELLRVCYDSDAEGLLSREEYEQGYHFCYDWDELFIGPDDEEFQCCTCHPLAPGYRGEPEAS